MTCRKGLHICFLGFLILSTGCAPTSKATRSQGSPGELPGCYAVFPAEPWESVHRLEATIRGDSFLALGVTKGEPSERRLQSLLLTSEGFILFDAERRENGMDVKKAVPPFDSPAFARGLMEDVALLFLPPQVKPRIWGKESNGTMSCKWKDADGSHTELTGSMEAGWRILRQDKKGKVIKEMFLNGPFVNGLASRIELRAFEPAPYRLRMTLLQPAP
jgi:hypothetical protein